MTYAKNILPKSSAYYTLGNARIDDTDLIIEAGGYAEFNISKQLLPKLPESILLVVHSTEFSGHYTNDVVQVNISIITYEGERIEVLVPVSQHTSGIFNAEISLPVTDYVSMVYRISSTKQVTIYNWELCAAEDPSITEAINGVEQTIPKVLYDYNIYPYVVDQRELTVGLISCYLRNATDLQGHFSISFFATERCNVHVRIKDNSITELYSPQVYTVEKGYASIDIPHAYIKKLATEHAFSVTMQCTNGQLSVPVRGMMYTIDGGYLATRLLDAGLDVEDISIRQVSTDYSPSEIWAVGFESKQLILKKRAYGIQNRVNWLAVKDFGEAITGKVEFAGKWVNRNNSDRHTIDTEETPVVFVLRDDNTLVAYHGTKFDEQYILDTEVTHVETCLGYSSILDAEQDQGLVVVYIKNGNVYYKQWKYLANLDRKDWQFSSVLYDVGDASFASVHRLPDYRLGICVVHSQGTKWFITDRTYVRQGVKPELVRSSIKSDFFITTIHAKDTTTEAISATTNTFEPGFTFNDFVITYNYPVVLLPGKTLDDFKKSIKLYINNSLLTSNSVDSLIIDENVITIRTKEDIGSDRTLKIVFDLPPLTVALLTTDGGLNTNFMKEFSWTFVRPIVTHERTLQTEYSSATIKGAIDIQVREIITSNVPCLEAIPTVLKPSLNIVVSEIIIPSKQHYEEVPIDMTSALSLKISQTGDTPV